jgi:DNA polymerase-3 subunit epsilon
VKLKYSDERLIFIDVETTGLEAIRGHRVIEVGAVRVEGGKIIEEFHSFIQTYRIISIGATKIHRITNAMMIGQPHPEVVYPALQEFIGESPLVAHNAIFDRTFLQREFKRLGMDMNNRMICTLEMSRQRFPDLPDHRLETVARHVLGQLPARVKLHRALDDAKMTAKIWISMVKP